MTAGLARLLFRGGDFSADFTELAMIPLSDLPVFSSAALLLALTPGPNMNYLLSRTICQGSRAVRPEPTKLAGWYKSVIHHQNGRAA